MKLLTRLVTTLRGLAATAAPAFLQGEQVTFVERQDEITTTCARKVLNGVSVDAAGVATLDPSERSASGNKADLYRRRCDAVLADAPARAAPTLRTCWASGRPRCG